MQTSDNVALSESVQVVVDSNLAVFDVIQTSSLVPQETGQQSFGGFAGFYFGQSYFADGTNNERQENDSSTLLLLSSIALSETVAVTENRSLEVPVNIQKSESITASESANYLLLSFVTVSGAIGLVESAQVFIPTLPINLSEDIHADESAFVVIPQSGTSTIIVQESVQVVQSTNLLIPELFLSVIDTASISEQLSLSEQSFIAVSQSISVSESRSLLIESNISKTDNVTTSEQVLLTKVSHILASDSISLSENYNVGIPSSILVEDQIEIADGIEESLTISIHVTDSTSLNEVVTITISVYLPRMGLLGVG